MLLIISACVLHNFCLIHDDFDDGYFGDDDDGGDGPAIALRRRAEQKRVHIMALL